MLTGTQNPLTVALAAGWAEQVSVSKLIETYRMPISSLAETFGPDRMAISSLAETFGPDRMPISSLAETSGPDRMAISSLAETFGPSPLLRGALAAAYAPAMTLANFAAPFAFPAESDFGPDGELEADALTLSVWLHGLAPRTRRTLLLAAALMIITISEWAEGEIGLEPDPQTTRLFAALLAIAGFLAALENSRS